MDGIGINNDWLSISIRYWKTEGTDSRMLAKTAEYILAFRGHWVKENGLKKETSVVLTNRMFLIYGTISISKLGDSVVFLPFS
ncbi:hypothetical protein [Brevibacillus laterosporus]|uniref:hypothetical protein n=1 Tax=Brevibacillus laterosporus TaxID=1465 RepID=UPI003D220B28